MISSTWLAVTCCSLCRGVNCLCNIATLRIYLAQFVVHREQRSTLKLTTWHLADAHALRQTVLPTYARAPWIVRSGKRPTYARARWIARVSFFTCFHTISLERSRFGKIATLIYPSSRCSQPVGTTHWPPRSL